MANTAFIGRGWLLYTGTLPGAAPHRHHALQVVLARRGLLEIGDQAGLTASGAGAVIPGNTWHSTPSPLASATLLYLDCQTPAGRQLGQRIGAAASDWVIAGQALEPLRCTPPPRDAAEASTIAQTIVRQISGLDEEQAPAAPGGARIDAQLCCLADSLAKPDGLPTARQLAAQSGMSPRHLSRLFNRGVGLSMPAYIRWLRLRRVAEALAEGATLTQAAHAAGFSDSAHLSRAFRASFGMAPSRIMRDTVLYSCDLPL